MQTINGITISQIIKNDINELSQDSRFTLYEVFEILQNYLHPKDIMKLLDIGKTSYYDYKKYRKGKYVERRLYDFYLQLDF